MMKIRRHVGQAAHIPAKRSPQGTPASDSSTQAGNPIATSRGDEYAKNIVASSTPPATIALSVLLALSVVALISGCVWWRIKKRRNRKGGLYVSSSPRSDLFGLESRPETDSSSFVGVSASSIEKPEKALVVPNPFPHEETGWVPQIKNYKGVPVINGQLPAHVQAARDGKRWLKALSRGTLNEKSEAPPSYHVRNGSYSNRSSDATLVRGGPPGIPLPPTPPNVNVRPPTPPTPPANGKKPKFSPPPLSSTTELSKPPSSRFSLSPLPPKTPGSSVEPLPSPARNTSFSHQQSTAPLQTSTKSSLFKSGSGNDGLSLPRLMSVTNTFTPSLEDEMLIHIGDTIRMVEEYTDGWCLVQRVGKPDAPKGVVPRFCLTERQSVVPPTTSSRRNLIKSIQATAKRL
ncbi:fus1 actin binding activity protein [Marasmius tenuissimus]|nr:fus1 actin binding activity protein [Marasmius tenuissimus]